MKATPDMTPTEFLGWTYRVKNAVSGWLDTTKIQAIRRTLPADLPEVPETGTADEKEAVRKARMEKIRAQGTENLLRIIDEIAGEEHRGETARLIAVLCGVDPEQADKHPMRDYMKVLNDTMEDAQTLRFFSSCLSLGKTAGLTARS